MLAQLKPTSRREKPAHMAGLGQIIRGDALVGGNHYAE